MRCITSRLSIDFRRSSASGVRLVGQTNCAERRREEVSYCCFVWNKGQKIKHQRQRKAISFSNDTRATYGTLLDLFEQTQHGRMRKWEFTHKQSIHKDACRPHVRRFAFVRSAVDDLRCWTWKTRCMLVQAERGWRMVSSLNQRWKKGEKGDPGRQRARH